MTCTTCHSVNPSGATRCYRCNSLLPVAAQAAARGWYGGEPDPWTGPGRPDETHYAGHADPVGSGAAAEQRARHDDVPRTPDLIYHPDGTIALGTRPRLAGQPDVRRGRRANPLRLLGPLAPLAALLAKLKFVLAALFKFKLALTAVTMLVSIVTYAWALNLGLAAAVGFVVLLFIHEMGHWIVMRLKGVPASAPIFIPFLGAVISMRGMPRSVRDEAEIGIAGPIAGTAGALVCLGIGQVYGGALWPWLGVIGLFLNLFNLLPVSPLDGGRVAAAISRWLWPVGLVGLLALFILTHNPFLLLVTVIGGAETVARFRGRHAPTAHPGYYDISKAERLAITVLYFGLIALIGVLMLTSPLLQVSG